MIGGTLRRRHWHHESAVFGTPLRRLLSGNDHQIVCLVTPPPANAPGGIIVVRPDSEMPMLVND